MVNAAPPTAVSKPTPVEPYSLDKAEPIPGDKFPQPAKGGRPAPPTTIPNLKYMLRHYGISIRYNVIKKCLTHQFPGMVINPDNGDNVALAEATSLAVLNGFQAQHIPAYIDAIGDRDAFNPVADWIESRPWDGVDRLQALQQTLTVADDFPVELRNVLMFRWLLSATAAAVLLKGFHARGVLTLQGAQGIGKTSWIRNLIPEPLRSSVLKIDHHLDASNKDSIIGAISHWIVEIGELDSSFRKDVARLKGFLTGDQDKVRRPYARADSHYPRRTVFTASVNEAAFLVDNTGNFRWWTLPVIAINFNHGIDMQQLFAQLKGDIDRGEQWWLTPSEEAMLEEQNKQHLSVSVIRDKFLQHLEKVKEAKSVAQSTEAKNATEVLLMLGFENPSNGQAKECAAILREQLGQHKRINGFNKWHVPVAKTTLAYPR